jgi:hypothetical protein
MKVDVNVIIRNPLGVKIHIAIFIYKKNFHLAVKLPNCAFFCLKKNM